MRLSIPPVIHQILSPERILLFLKGLAMGAADAVPGVSGGTIAFITGIYEELLDSIRSFTPALWPLIRQGHFREAWRAVNGPFLAVLLSGIAVSLLLFARIIVFGLRYRPVWIWSFFFGLILASAILILRQVRKNGPVTWLWGMAGAALGAAVTMLTPIKSPDHALAIFLSGAVAICAMILPGISGSFILIILNKYRFVVTALLEFHVSVILVFSAGCACGLLSFSRLLHYTLRRWRDSSLAFLTGVMLGALNKVWPWKEVLSTRTDSHGRILPLLERNVWPETYAKLTGRPDDLVIALILAALGFGMVMLLARYGPSSSRGETGKP